MNLTLEGREGDAVLVLSNALGTTSAMWRPQIPELCSRFRLALYDHPPLDSVPALAADVLLSLDEHGINCFSFCGLSLGAMVGMQLAVDAPQRLDRLVLACTAARFGRPEEWAVKAALVRRAGNTSRCSSRCGASRTRAASRRSGASTSATA
jgi:pimeloyl-ACP methyl ester carboxylesterase